MRRIVQSFLIFLALISSLRSFSQMPACPNGLVYFHTSPIQVYNPALPISATNPSNTGIPLGGTGLSVGPNIFAAGPSPTYFTTIGNFFAYWNGASWITTTVSCSNSAAVNIGSGPGCIYNLVGGTGQVYVSNGTGPATLLVTIGTFAGGGPYDLVVDDCCNFYILKTTTPQSMTMYNSSGVQQCTYSMTGMGNISAGGGFAIVGNQVIVSNTGGLYVGNITGSTITFTNVSTNSYGAGDFANCPLPCGPLTATAVNTASSSPIGCGGGTANVIVTTTTSPVSYTWSGPGIVSGVNSATAVVNQCGVYTATVTKAGCPPATTVVTTSITCVTSFTPTIAISNPLTCTQPTAQITASPMPPGYTYTWTGPGIVGSINADPITANVGGVYTATVLNTVTGCKGTVSINLPVNMATPPLTVTPNPANICLGNSANLSVVGANTYTWSPGATLNTTNGPNVVATPPVNTTYTVVGTVGTCTASTTAIVNINPQPSAILSTTNATCGNNNGQIIITNTSGPLQTVSGYSVNGVGVGTQTVSGLAAGNYTITMVNNFGCVVSFTTSITNSPAITALATTFINATCGNNNGSITLGAVTGGTGPYTYNVNGGPYSASPTLTNLAAGSYTIGVMDSKGCTFIKIVTIVNIPGPTALSFTTTPNSCIGSAGSVTIGVTGGTAAYTYTIDGVGIAGNTATGLATGTHTATVKDANGCLITATFNIGVVSGPTAAVIVTSNAACGNANGSATVTSVTGGLGPYQYSFNGGPFSTNNFVAGLLSGPHSVVIKDANSCTLTVNFIVNNTGSPVSSIGSQTNVSCFGGNNGGVTINTSGGTPGYSYTITPTNVTSGTGVFTNLTAQGYTVNVKDAAGCVTTVTLTITQPLALTLTLTSLPTSCNGGTNGTITAVGGGGTGPYTYDLNGGPFQVSGVFTGNAAGIYNITVKDNNGCTLTQSVQVTQPTPITLTLTSINANCTAANGTASVTVAGGTPFYNYSWSGGGGTGSQTSPLASGLYTVTVTDSKGCTKVGTVTINSTPGGVAVISSSVSPTCFGFTNGSMTAGFTGAMTAPISYSWSNGQTTQTAVNLGAGPYSVTLTDAFGCTSTVSGTLTAPGMLDVQASANPVSCFGGSNGNATATYNSGGTLPLTYLWAAGGATTAVAPNLPAGIYTVTVTDALGCIAVVTTTVTQPTSVTITSTATTANCNQSNGSATLTATGGTGPYTYTWSTGANTATLSGVAAGTYTVIVKDANGCIFNSAATVPNTAGPTLAITGFTNVSCFGGNNALATTSVSGGTGPYVYLWSNAQNTGNATNLMAGIYTATVTDANGCKASTSVTISQPPVLTVSVSGTDPKCFNATNGSANAGVIGGTPGYSYAWVPSGSTAQSPTGLGPGNHIVTVTDANGCITSGAVTLNNPPQMTAAITSTNVTCFGACNGMANGSGANTVGAVIYFWTGGPGPLTTQNVTNLCPGTYTLLATDANGCTAQALTTITQPPLLTASITASGNASCAGYTNGFATVAPAGGTPGYTYSWSPSGGTGSTANNLAAGNYIATVTDSKGCTATANVTITQPTPLVATITSTNITCFGLNNGISNIAYSGGTGPYNFLWLPTLNNTPNVTTLPPGTHTIQVTDNLGCITTLTTVITQPPALTAVVSSTNSNCTQANGSACVVAGGGAGGYTYQWSSNPLFTNSCITNVVAGAYTVTVTDVNGCSISGIANINDIAGPSIAVTATSAVSCFGGNNGSATTNISGGTGTISILWSYLAQTTQNVNNLPAGLHSITIIDAAGCVASASVQITQPPLLTTAITNVTMVTCAGSNNGSATMLVNGGTPGYNYAWTPTAQTSSIAVSMAPGIYTCVVTDANGCTSSQNVTITQPNPLTISSAVITNLTCNGNNTGAIATIVTGGSPAYTINWTPAQPNNAVITNLAAGTYSLSVTDTKGCTANGVYVVTEPAALVTSATATPATCGNANGSATVTVNGGTPGYTYNWNTPSIQITAVATGLSSNTWSCTITDSKGCIITQSVNVPNAPAPTLTSMTFTPPLCFGQQNGSMAINFSSGTSPFTFAWNNPGASTTQTVNGVGAGVYSATVTDMYGCAASGVVNVTQPNILLLTVSADPTICYGQQAQIYAAGAGGTPAYSYTWNPATLVGAGPHAVTPTVTTQYIVNMTDANGCSVNPKVVTVNVKPQLLATGGSTTICHGSQTNLNPNITSPGNGGPYTYNWTGGSTASNIVVTGNYPSTPNLYTVNIADGCTFPGATAVFTVNVNPLPSGYFTADVLKGCAPLHVNFNAISTSTSDTYVWGLGGGIGGGNTAGGNPINWYYPNSGWYTITLSIYNQFGCKKDTVAANYIEVYPVPIAEFNANPWSTTILDPNIQFTNLSIGAVSYFWDFGDYSSPNNNTTAVDPSHSYELAGVYQVWLVAFNDKGCTDTIMHTIEILSDYSLYIPNTFTPDGNGLNDIFQPKGVGIDEDNYKMYIFDRWGELVFTSDQFRKGWDGTIKGNPKIAEQGVYTYKILVKDLDGNVHQYIGHVNCLPRQSKVD
jgi:gliding motility-associated-like protein